MSQKVYEIVTQQIIEKLEEGVIPWKRPFAKRPAVNWVTQKPYRGINTLLLDGGEYATFNQIKKHGGRVKKGEKSNLVVFWKLIEIEDEETEEIKKIPLLRYYRVFEINTQVEGLESKRKGVSTLDYDPIKAERIIKNYPNPPKIRHVAGRAYYQPSNDLVNVPDKQEFKKVEDYYSVFFHELVHSTGHEKRLNRKGITDLKNNPFGSHLYSKEELVAEIGASMLCGVAGIVDQTIDNSTTYIKGWLEVLRNDNRLVVQASQQAQKACDYILGKTYDEEPEWGEDRL